MTQYRVVRTPGTCGYFYVVQELASSRLFGSSWDKLATFSTKSLALEYIQRLIDGPEIVYETKGGA